MAKSYSYILFDLDGTLTDSGPRIMNGFAYKIPECGRIPAGTEKSLRNRLLREIYQELLAGVRGLEKNPGEFRRSQNWIGAANCTLKEARYIPPNVEDMNAALAELERYMNEAIPILLVKLGEEGMLGLMDLLGRV